MGGMRFIENNKALCMLSVFGSSGSRTSIACPGDFDVVRALGSLINAPLAVIRSEIARIKQHLRPGERWLHFAYPKAR